MHDKRARLNPEVRSRDAIIVQDTQSPKHGAYGKNYTGDRNSVWVKRVEPKLVQNLIGGDLNGANALKLGEHQSAGGTGKNTETNGAEDVQLQKTSSEASCVLKSGEPKTSDTGSIQQQRESHVLEKEAALELNLQKGKDQAPSVLVSTNEKSYAASARTYTSLSRQCGNSGNGVQQQRRWSHLIQRHGVAHDGLKHKHTDIVSAKGTNLHEANLKTRSGNAVRSSTSRPYDGCADLYVRNNRNFEVGGPSEN
jgi:hypothetical protein